jgi:hypothetical protein
MDTLLFLDGEWFRPIVCDYRHTYYRSFYNHWYQYNNYNRELVKLN